MVVVFLLPRCARLITMAHKIRSQQTKIQAACLPPSFNLPVMTATHHFRWLGHAAWCVRMVGADDDDLSWRPSPCVSVRQPVACPGVPFLGCPRSLVASAKHHGERGGGVVRPGLSHRPTHPRHTSVPCALRRAARQDGMSAPGAGRHSLLLTTRMAQEAGSPMSGVAVVPGCLSRSQRVTGVWVRQWRRFRRVGPTP